MTDSGVTSHFPHETDQPSIVSDVFAQIESRFNLNSSETGFHDPSVRVAAISTFDKAIDAARRLVLSLLTRRNSIVPISLLPPEILARIFHLLGFNDRALAREKKESWIKVTHVCRHWRQVALDDSTLWAKIWGIPGIPMSNRCRWMPEMLARAKNAPLDIELYSVSTEALLIFLPHLSRTRQLRIDGLSRSDSKIVQEIYGCEAPALEHFELGVGNDVYASPITFPHLGGSMLFKGHAPRLRTLSFHRALIPWSLVPRGQLTQLEMSSKRRDIHYLGDLDQLVDLLANCPALEILTLAFCLPSQLTDSPHGRTTHLPNLSHLCLCDSTSRIINMLKMLKLPSSTKLHLDCMSQITSIHHDSEVLPIITTHFQSPAPIEFKSLTVVTWSPVLEITASTFPSTLQGDIFGIPELVLSFNDLSKSGHSTDLLKQACKMLPISNLEFISMSVTNIININWVELFSCCTNVTTMEAIEPGASSLVKALTAPMVTDASSNKEGRKRKHGNSESTLVQPAGTVAHAHTAIFPKLKFLGLSQLNFSEGNHRSCVPFDIFERGLRQRMATSGAPLESLHISRCKISTERANDLRKLVQDFQRDGKDH